MGVVSVLNTAFASIALFTCILQLFLSIKRKGDNISVISAVLSLVVFFRYGMIFLCSSSQVVTEYHLTIWRCQLILTQLVLMCMAGVIFILLQDKRKRLFLVNIIAIAVLTVITLIIPDYQLFDSKNVVYIQNEIIATNNIPMISPGFTWWRAITDITVLLFIYLSFSLLIKYLKSEHRQKIIILIIGSSLISLAAIYDQFVDLGMIHSTYLVPIMLFVQYLIFNFIPYLFLLAEVEQNIVISQQERKWRNLVNDAGVIVVGLNRMGQVEFVNPFFLELTGFKEDEVLGKDWFEHFIPTKEAYNVQGAFVEALASEFQPYYINSILTKSKEEKIIRWYNVRTRDNNDNITGSLSLGLDITEDVSEKEDLIQKLKSAREMIDKSKKNQ